MLNIQDIISRVNKPQSCSINDIDDLHLLTEKFPYAQIFPILYLKALSSRKDIRFEEELRKYAYQITDRAQLYQLVQLSLGSFHSDYEIETLPKKGESKAHSSDSLNAQIIVNHEDSDIQSIQDTEQKDTDTELIPLEDNCPSDESTNDIDEVELIPLNIRKNELPGETLGRTNDFTDSFEKELIAETLSSTYLLSSFETEDLTDEGHIERFEEESEKSEKTESSTHPSAQRSFNSWLRSNRNDERPIIDEEKARIEAILEQFIEKQPSINRHGKSLEDQKPKKEFYSAVKKAKESIQIQHMPVSETLAKIFAMQGNYPKAIYVYEQLLLINPEKKIFFASQIENLQKKITR